ncbi:MULTISPECIES: hypothetical protein [unclassified Mesorhizobium]|uniref:hypothetical protein n=1 Tax=unclassified Mesorhizobium TaxID=325217 RepID=UPI000FCC57C5|nr:MULTISPECIES: hypothetical protein [unclassified Mesorhizobium]RUV27038.1 hypothetical protein EOA91_01895 [Mesorhizobium sp. M1A.F.Ca.IN.022.04.1.1]RWG35579.1 MAG: hypothetical protein EOQ60_06705 [Mesorhizobium sp.]
MAEKPQTAAEPLARQQSGAENDPSAVAFAGRTPRDATRAPSPVFCFSENPGAYEMHLIRRLNNPYFDPERRQITLEQLDHARHKDREQLEKASAKFEGVLKLVSDLPEVATLRELEPVRLALEGTIKFATGAGGQAKQVASQCDRLREAWIETFRKCLSDDPRSMEAFAAANNRFDERMRRYSVPLTVQFSIENGPIPREEIFATFLSEEPKRLESAMRALGVNAARPLAEGCLELMIRRIEEGMDDPQDLSGDIVSDPEGRRSK